MKTIETLYKEIQEEGQKNVEKADRLLDAILALEKAFDKAVKTVKAAADELTREKNDFDKKEEEAGL